MSAIGSASARGPEMWSDTLVRGFVEQRLQRGVLQRFGRGRIVEYALEGVVDTQGLADLLDRPRVVARVGGGGLLGAEDESMEGRHVRQALVAFRVPERRVQQGERCTRVEEVVHVRDPGAAEARQDREPFVVLQPDEPRVV